LSIINCQHINKSFGSQRVLNDVTLEIPAGQVVGLLGPNGAGKSTLMKILMGLWKPDSGTVSVPASVGYLPENNPLYDEMYVTEYLEFMAGLTNRQIVKSSNRQIVNDLIDLVGLTPERHKHIRELSKGYRQRVGLAQALIGNPELLILDEPTTGLDPNQLIEIRALIKSLTHSPSNPSVILSTHIMQEVEAMCTRAIIINHGKLVSDDHLGHITSQQLTEKFHQVTAQ
jgi:ABC-2 type transport system ATP-binding protein